jgi:hypothetical protein
MNDVLNTIEYEVVDPVAHEIAVFKDFDFTDAWVDVIDNFLEEYFNQEFLREGFIF